MIGLTDKIAATGSPEGLPFRDYASDGGNDTRHRDRLLARFGDRIAVNPDLSRALVSWQSNRDVAGFRWFKYKEGFSAGLVRYLLNHMGEPGALLDPFAGTGVAPVTSAKAGWQGIGIEILPVAAKFAKSYVVNAIDVDAEEFRFLSTGSFWTASLMQMRGVPSRVRRFRTYG